MSAEKKTAVAEAPTPAQVMERVILGGDLSQLRPEDRVVYYNEVCKSVKLNPLTKPFDYLVLDNKEVLYANRGCADQLRMIHGVSVKVVMREFLDDVYMVVARATTKDGREDESSGVVAMAKEGGEWAEARSGKRFFKKDGSLHKLVGVERANALMKAETKAKRRVTLSICGLSMPDESELEDIVTVNLPDANEARDIAMPQRKSNAPPPEPPLGGMTGTEAEATKAPETTAAASPPPALEPSNHKPPDARPLNPVQFNIISKKLKAANKTVEQLLLHLKRKEVGELNTADLYPIQQWLEAKA